MKPLKILGMGKYLPSYQVSSEQLEQAWGLENGWIYKLNGVRYRHYAAKDELRYQMGAKAFQQALDKANLSFTDLDLIIDASGSFDYPIPHNACFYPAALGYPEYPIPCWDIDSTCLSFVTALDTASYLLDGHRYKHIAIVSSEISSKALDPKDPKTASLFGDAAAAAIIGLPKEGTQNAILAADMKTYSKGATYTMMPGGGAAFPPGQLADKAMYSFQMQGSKVMRMAMQIVPPFVKGLLETAGIEITALNCFIPHQASKRGLQFARRAFQLKEEQLIDILAKYGNCISASIPLALCEAIEENRLQRGQYALLLGTAAGLSVGGILLRY